MRKSASSSGSKTIPSIIYFRPLKHFSLVARAPPRACSLRSPRRDKAKAIERFAVYQIAMSRCRLLRTDATLENHYLDRACMSLSEVLEILPSEWCRYSYARERVARKEEWFGSWARYRVLIDTLGLSARLCV